MKKTLIYGLVLIAASAPASAWEVSTNQDPMTDAKTVAVVQDADASNPMNPWALMFKCWEGKPDQTSLAILTPEDFNSAAQYPSSIDVKLRIDKAETFTIVLAPIQLGGKLILATRAGLSVAVFDTIKAMQDAKKQLAFQVLTEVHTVNAAGSSNAIGKMISGCGLDMSKNPADQ